MKSDLKYIIQVLIFFFLAGLPIWVSQLVWHKVDGALMFLVVPAWVWILASIGKSNYKK